MVHSSMKLALVGPACPEPPGTALDCVAGLRFSKYPASGTPHPGAAIPVPDAVIPAKAGIHFFVQD